MQSYYSNYLILNQFKLFSICKIVTNRSTTANKKAQQRFMWNNCFLSATLDQNTPNKIMRKREKNVVSKMYFLFVHIIC